MEPKTVKLPFKVKRPILGLGGATKNTLCFARGRLAYLSPLHKNLSELGDFFSFEQDVKLFLKKSPRVIACDLHPEYPSTQYASFLLRGAPLLIQHHHAHIASCMVENGLENQRVIGVAFDGTGLGSDNTLWGAEFLICDYKSFKRTAHLREVLLLGGERAILEPWRIAVLWLYLAYGDRFLASGLEFVKKIDKNKWRVLKDMYLSGLNSPLASSMGRLFDAAASLILAKHNSSFEAELAIELEKLALTYKRPAAGYGFKLGKKRDEFILDPLPMFKQLCLDLRHKEPREKIAYRFHQSVARMISATCAAIRKENKINKVVLSGGVFQNNLLLHLSLDLLYKERFRVFAQSGSFCNDSGISLGQMAVANFRG